MEIEIHQLPKSLKLNENQLSELVKKVCLEIALKAHSIAFVFVDDEYLAEMHDQYLDDPDKTDVITFNLGDENIEGEIYISFERALEQAKEFNVTLEEEIIRLIIHGLLHLAGYDDLNDSDRNKMKAVEKTLLGKFFNNI